MTPAVFYVNTLFFVSIGQFQWKLLLKDYKEAKEYIDDIRDICDDFEGLCQRNLAANTGKLDRAMLYCLCFSSSYYCSMFISPTLNGP